MSSGYIEKDEAIEAVEQVVWDDCFWKDIEKAIKKIPTADVRENVYGAWIEDGYRDEPIVCSYCGEPSTKRTKFCPECGSYNEGRNNAK